MNCFSAEEEEEGKGGEGSASSSCAELVFAKMIKSLAPSSFLLQWP